jgi:hypothetical protein
VHDRSRVLVLRVDEQARTATLLRSYTHPRKLLSGSQGNAQFLPNGHVVVGWGSNPYVTELDRSGRVLLDLRFVAGKEADSYRAYRFRWTGLPRDRPTLRVSGATAYVSWNGATEVARWRLSEKDGDHLIAQTTVPKTGFETAIPTLPDAQWLTVEALSRRGKVLGVSQRVERS